MKEIIVSFRLMVEDAKVEELMQSDLLTRLVPVLQDLADAHGTAIEVDWLEITCKKDLKDAEAS